jgi:hypothetical protein
MKKLLVTLTAVLVSVSAFGQGSVIFNNRVGTVDAPIRRPDGTGAGAGVTAQLYLVGAGGALTALTPTSTFRTTSAAAAFYLNQVTVTVPGIAPGNPGTFRIRAWEGASYDTSLLKGESNDVTITQLGGQPSTGAPIPDPALAGLTGFALVAVPEPSTMALGLLGAAALLYRRRK